MRVGGVYRYVGDRHPWARNLTVAIVAVHRGDQILRDVEVEPDDVIEFAPWIHAEERFSWVTSDAHPEELAAL